MRLTAGERVSEIGHFSTFCLQKLLLEKNVKYLGSSNDVRSFIKNCPEGFKGFPFSKKGRV